jgi:transcriptional regulator with XRE-family HTH domain
MTAQLQIMLRTRKLGVLIKDARLASRKTPTECAAATGISAPNLRAYEEGRKAPSLPELEVLAYYFNLPIQHFWTGEALSDQPARTEPLNLKSLAALRQRIIGALLRRKREDAGVAASVLSAETGIPVARLKSYELGEKPIPLPELEVCLNILGVRIEAFFDQAGPIGKWMAEQRAIQEFLKLPADLQNFVCAPVNRPYLELARTLSEMPTDKMRSVAEGLLDITL